MTRAKATTPAVFDASVVAAEIEEDYPPFPFIGLDGVEYSIPSPMLMNGGAMRRLTELADGAVGSDSEGYTLTIDVIRQFAGEDIADALEAMPPAVMVRLLAAWMAQSEDQLNAADAEEGGAVKKRSPSSPPNRAARRSGQTSRRKATGSTAGRSTK